MSAVGGDRQHQMWRVATFKSTFDAMEAERLCRASGVTGRLIPTPVQVRADCGLAWRLPTDPAALAAFEKAVEGRVRIAATFEVLL